MKPADHQFRRIDQTVVQAGHLAGPETTRRLRFLQLTAKTRLALGGPNEEAILTVTREQLVVLQILGRLSLSIQQRFDALDDVSSTGEKELEKLDVRLKRYVAGRHQAILRGPYMKTLNSQNPTPKRERVGSWELDVGSFCFLEIHRQRNTHEPWSHDLRGVPALDGRSGRIVHVVDRPRAVQIVRVVGRVHSGYCVVVEQVVDVNADAEPLPGESDVLPRGQVPVEGSFGIQVAGVEQIDRLCRIIGARGDSPELGVAGAVRATRLPHRRGKRHIQVRDNCVPWAGLEGHAQQHSNPRNRIAPAGAHVCLERLLGDAAALVKVAHPALDVWSVLVEVARVSDSATCARASRNSEAAWAPEHEVGVHPVPRVFERDVWSKSQ